MTMSSRNLLAAVATIVAIGTSPRVWAGNEVRAVSFSEDAGVTQVHVRGAQTPTFTVYKLERPTRVVIDLPQAKLADVLKGHDTSATVEANTWAVSTIAAQQLDDGAVRVIVSLARPGRYDVKTDGNDVVVSVMPRDAAPKTANPAELARMQAENDQVKKQAQAAEQARAAAEKSSDAANATAKQSRAEADAAKAEAERLRRVASEQAARAETAQKAVEAAKKLAQNNAANAAELARAKQNAQAANDEAARAKAQAEAAKKASALAQIEADKARIAAEQARRDALAEAAMAKSDAAKARDEMTKAQAEAAKTRADAKSDVARAQAEAQELVAKSRAEAEAAKRQAAQAMTLAERTKLEADQARKDAALAKSESAKAKGDAETARAEAARAKSDAEAMRVTAAADKRQAETDKQKAEAARAEAERLMKDAKSQLAQLDKKSRDAQTLEDQARTALAAAQAREESARESAARARQEREVAEAAAKRAQEARDKSAAADRARLVADAEAAEARLAKARQATQEAESRRVAAEKAASSAKQDLEQSRTALAGVEQQRTAAVTAATDAARKRSEAEAAASDAVRRRSEAEIAANAATKKQREAEAAASEATQRRGEAETQRARAEQQRLAALEAARAAQAAKEAADKQRMVAEAAAKQAVAAKRDAEASVAELTAKRAAAERAAEELATRTKAEAKAQADMIAAKTRKASDDEIAAAKREVARLAEERKRAEADLADRRQAVAQQQAEATRLATAAAQARDAATREDSRRTELADARAKEEQALARVQAQKVAAQSQAQAATQAAAEAQQKQLAAEAQAKQLVAAAEAKQKAQAVQAQVAQTQTRSMQPVVTKPGKITGVTFKGSDAAGVVEIAMAGDANVTLGDISARQVELVVDNAELAQKLERTLDVSKFGSPVRRVSSFRDRRTQNRVRLVAELASPAIPTVVRDNGVVRWRFAANDAAKRTAVRTQNIPPTVVGGFGAASTPVAQQSVSQVPAAGAQAPRNRRIYHGATVDFDFKDAPIHDLLRILSDTGGVNIVVPDTIDAKVTVRLKRVPWDQALEVILASHGLWYRREGNLYRIAPRKELDAEDEAEAARRAAAVAAEMPRPEVVTLNYASADELRGKLEGMLSPKGKIEVDGRTNALIINDVGANREQIARLALQLDTQTPQITIEARIVEARSTFVRQFGIQWGGRALAGAAGGNATGLVFPSSIGVVGGNTDAQTNSAGISALPSDFAINLPAATGTGEGGAIGLSLGSVGGNFNINIRLSALEDTGTVRIISAPKITVLNNKAALIRQGVSIPISVVSAAGTQTQFVQADLKLEVTPYVSQRDCAIAMNLDVTKNEPDFVNVGARGDPTILRKEAKTTMLVNDGDTAVLGGIYTRNTGLAYKKVPFFGDLPVIGWFFKNRRENDDRTEILVFITPKITNKAYLRCAQ